MDTLAKIQQKHEEERKYRNIEVVRRVALYARQSVDKKDSISIETQLLECKKLLREGEAFKEYEDKGYSGKNIDRPAFQQLIQDIQAGKISRVIVYKLDRCTRSVLDFYQFAELLKQNSCDFTSTKERDIDTTTPSGRAMIGMIAIFAELERETIRQRIIDNYYNRIVRDGRWPGGPAPYGFNVKNHAKPPRLEYNEEENKVVRFIYERYFKDASTSLLGIVRELEKQGHKGRKGKNFRTTAILNVLRNPIYTKADTTLFYYFQSQGITPINPIEEWNGTRTAHIISAKQGKKYIKDNSINSIVYLTNIEGFIDSRQYIQIQNRLANNKQMARGTKPSKMEWLAGLLKCKKCGYGIRIYSHDHKYLSCFGKSVMHECDATFSVKQITFEEVKARVAQKIQEHIAEMEITTQHKKAEWDKIQNEIKQNEKEIERLIELSFSVDIPTIAQRIREKQEKINNLKLQGDYFTERLAYYEDIVFLLLSDEEKKKIANELIKKIYLSEDGSVEIEWKI